MSHRGQKSARVLVKETREPPLPQNWPDGHVAVTLTGNDEAECIEDTTRGVRHYLHSTTARELSNTLVARIDEWNVIARAGGARGV
jgi:hypothetical protein